MLFCIYVQSHQKVSSREELLEDDELEQENNFFIMQLFYLYFPCFVKRKKDAPQKKVRPKKV